MPEFLTGALEAGPVLTWEKVAVRLIAALDQPLTVGRDTGNGVH